MRMIRHAISLLCLLLLTVSLAFARLSGGSLTGTVTDPNGEVVAGAKIIAGGISGGQRRSKKILIDGVKATNPESGGVDFNGLPADESIGEFKLYNHGAVIGGF